MATLTAPDAVAMDSQKLEQVKQLFQRQIDEGLHPGAGLAVYRYGNLVMDIHGGIANTEPVTADTMFVLMSSTKPLTASCLYILKERRKIAWDDLVSKHWPEFGQNGKETVTIRHILTHRGGFPQTPESLPWTDWPDWSKVTRAMEQAPTIYTPGETLAYHPINYGWVIAEIVRRVDGRTFDRFIAEELTAPLGMDNTYVGLPAGLEGRVSPMHLMEDDADTSGYSGTFSEPAVLRSVVPGANGVASDRLSGGDKGGVPPEGGEREFPRPAAGGRVDSVLLDGHLLHLQPIGFGGDTLLRVCRNEQAGRPFRGARNL